MPARSILALLVWNLIQRLLRQFVEKKDKAIKGLGRKSTKKPTTYMLIRLFQHITVITWNQSLSRKISKPLNHHQMEYLEALNMNEKIFTKPVHPF